MLIKCAYLKKELYRDKYIKKISVERYTFNAAIFKNFIGKCCKINCRLNHNSDVKTPPKLILMWLVIL